MNNPNVFAVLHQRNVNNIALGHTVVQESAEVLLGFQPPDVQRIVDEYGNFVPLDTGFYIKTTFNSGMHKDAAKVEIKKQVDGFHPLHFHPYIFRGPANVGQALQDRLFPAFYSPALQLATLTCLNEYAKAHGNQSRESLFAD